MRQATCALVLLLLLADSAAGATKTDVVELRNGDRITCETRKPERGKLTVKTDGLGTVAIEWDDVERVSSKASYDVELESELRLRIARARRCGRGGRRSGYVWGPHLLCEIVRIAPVGGTFCPDPPRPARALAFDPGFCYSPPATVELVRPGL